MRILSFFFLAVLFLAASPVQAQEKLSKEDKKELKALVKKYKKDPMALKELVESVDMYKEQNAKLQAQINTLSGEDQMTETKVQQLEQSNIALNTKLAAAQQQIQELQNQPPPTVVSKGDDGMFGTVFRVQIGAYEKNYIPDNLDTSDSMTLELADGMQKVMVGQFRDYQEAKELMKHMKKVGLRDAWVVAYVDGSRVNLNDVVSRDEQ
jgi:DNA repair exonuclease SbcCD ATPase subunit